MSAAAEKVNAALADWFGMNLDERDETFGASLWPCPVCRAGTERDADGLYWRPVQVLDDSGNVVVNGKGGHRCTTEQVYEAIGTRPERPKIVEADAPSRRTSTSTIISSIKTVGDLAPNGAAVDWLWHGYLPVGGIVDFIAKPKEGKSTLLFALLAALESGDGFAGRPTRRARVLYVSEESEPQLRRKADKAGLSTEWHYMLAREHTYAAKWPELVDAAGQAARERGCAAVVFDTFSGLARLPGDDESTSGPMLEAFRWLHPLKHAGLGVLVVRHARKADGDLVDIARGSGAATGEADLIVGLRKASRQRADTRRRLETLGRYDESPETWDIDYDVASGVYTTTEAPVVARQREKVSEHLTILEGLGEATVAEYADAAGIGRRSASERLRDLEGQGLVSSSGRGTKADPLRFVVEVEEPLRGERLRHKEEPADVHVCRERRHQIRKHPRTGRATCVTCHGRGGRLPGEETVA